MYPTDRRRDTTRNYISPVAQNLSARTIFRKDPTALPPVTRWTWLRAHRRESPVRPAVIVAGGGGFDIGDHAREFVGLTRPQPTHSLLVVPFIVSAVARSVFWARTGHVQRSPACAANVHLNSGIANLYPGTE